MLELLDLAPGMRVLEIGTGTGYNAALLREIVGQGGSVASVDIDSDLVAQAAGRLAAAGYGDIHLAAVDGHFGWPDRSPFDRIVATVGCVDVAPPWLDQLADGGICLIPLQHGGWHPLTRIQAPGGVITASVVGRAAFVAIQGHQGEKSPWPQVPEFHANARMHWAPLSSDLAKRLRPDPDQVATTGQHTWDLAYLLALEDPRAVFLLSLNEDGSWAAIDPGAQRVGWTGPAGPALRDRMLEIAERWCALGRPTITDYTSTFRPMSYRDRHASGIGAENGHWIIDRIDYRQTVEINPQAC
jgi:protein-L-isoaspartate(D-aspartate) O-methyltransferase